MTDNRDWIVIFGCTSNMYEPHHITTLPCLVTLYLILENHKVFPFVTCSIAITMANIPNSKYLSKLVAQRMRLSSSLRRYTVRALISMLHKEKKISWKNVELQCGDESFGDCVIHIIRCEYLCDWPNITEFKMHFGFSLATILKLFNVLFHSTQLWAVVSVSIRYMAYRLQSK